MQYLEEQVRLLREIRLALQENDFARAIGDLERIVEIAKERGDYSAAARHLGNLALTYYRAGQPDPALAKFNDALICAREENDRMTENGLLGNMGNILRELGRYDEAMHYLNEALMIAQEVGDKRGRGIWLTNLGLVYDDLGQPSTAFDLHQQAVEIARQLFDQPNVALRLGHMGNSKVALGDYNEALKYFSDAANLYEQLGRDEDLALRLGIIGNLHAHIGRQTKDPIKAREHFKDALNYYERTLSLARDLKDTLSEAELLRSIGHVLINAGYHTEAASFLENAVQIFDQVQEKQKANEIRSLLQRLK
ncbi:MAG: tetratricopeptide repeat protein [Anaerolineae bacterium]|nr:tetratricopeptide repeat protein [Anaerolineae bacterium]